MQRFLDSNPGLRSRFSRELVFPDYATSELVEITAGFAAENGYVLESGSRETVARIFDSVKRGEAFGNARYARTLFEQALNAQALRLARDADRPVAELEPGTLMALESSDFAAGARTLGDGQADAVRRWPWQRAS
jgi:hypothetical protein